MADFDVAIVGLGAAGSATAWQLAKRGVRVVGLDRFTPPHAFGSSHGYGRIIREAYAEGSAYVPLVQRAFALWDELEAASGTPLRIVTGGLTIGAPGSTLVAGARESARRYQIAVSELDGRETSRRFPALAVPDDYTTVWEPRAGVVFPERGIQAMLNEATRHGAELLFDTPVSGWRRDGAVIRVATVARDISADRVLLSAGAWTTELAPPLGIRFIVERAVQFWFSPPAGSGLFAPDRLPVFVIDTVTNGVGYGLPDHGHGVKVAFHHGGEVTTADAVRRTIGDDERQAIVDVARRWLPALGSEIAEASVCLYTNTPDQHFLIDRHPADGAVLVASACSGHGFKFAPATGELLADLLLDQPIRVDAAPFAASRFAKP
jgi:sarcosine oxidase